MTISKSQDQYNWANVDTKLYTKGNVSWRSLQYSFFLVVDLIILPHRIWNNSFWHRRKEMVHSERYTRQHESTSSMNGGSLLCFYYLRVKREFSYYQSHCYHINNYQAIISKLESNNLTKKINVFRSIE